MSGSLLTRIYNAIDGFLFSSPTVACTQSSKKTEEESESGVSNVSDPIVLDDRDLGVLIGKCGLHADKFSDFSVAIGGSPNPLENISGNVNPPSYEENFWYAVARYLIETKYSPFISYQSTYSESENDIRKGISELAPNQREALTVILAEKLIATYKNYSDTMGRNYLLKLLPVKYQSPYEIVCRLKEPNTYDLIQQQSFTYQIPLLVSKKDLLNLIEQTKQNVPANIPPNKNAIVNALRADATLRKQVLAEFPQPFVSVCSVNPNSGELGQTLTVNLTGDMRNIYLNGQFVEGFAIDFGEGITVTLQKPPLDTGGSTTLPVNVTIKPDAPLGPRDIKVQTGNDLVTLKGAFEVKETISKPMEKTPQDGRSKSAKTEEDSGKKPKKQSEKPERKGFCDSNPNDPMCNF